LSAADNARDAVLLHVSAPSERQEWRNETGAMKNKTERHILTQRHVWSFCLVLLYNRAFRSASYITHYVTHVIIIILELHFICCRNTISKLEQCPHWNSILSFHKNTLHWLLVKKHLFNRNSIHNVMKSVYYIYTRNISLSVYQHNFKESVYLSK